MKRFLLSSVAFMAVVTTASAADLAARPYTKAPPLVAPAVYGWTGCYIGGNVGGGWSRTDQTQIAKVNGTPIVPNNNFGSATGDGNFIGGGQVGCDYQFAGNWVIGAQGMFDFGNIDSTHTLPAFPTFFAQDRVKWSTTATARLGYLVAPQVLAYVKGGAAWARFDQSIFGTPGNFLSETASTTRTGYTVGGGLEWMFAPGWSVFAEYNYLDFGRSDIAFVAAPGTFGLADVVSTRLTVSQAVAGVNYKFNFGGPVVARY